ncbi:sensor domain-containing diguanylate cyclase [Sporomusa malonica]|uniref:PAS domain S-box-containing protein/diguanylate cyclase (GGDEF) domain-containing protein n=2 Tax=Sporomusa malonica TaxID=112901 RepID=A0A1W2CYH5_9FIRM|nr:PAS domain S-box-containing protein/diguanylate cyclase (GGDEF) domain-containing protein [Sporomusa malonica]
MVFDIRTLIILNFIVTIINAGSIAIIWHQYKDRFEGISLWLASTILHAVGLFLIAMRSEIPAFVASVIANALLLTGAVVLLMGLERFAGIKRSHRQNYFLLVIFAVAVNYYTVIDPSMTMREIIMSVFIMIIKSQGSWLLLKKVALNLRPITRITGLVLGGYVVVSLVRGILLMLFPLQTNDFFKSGFADSMAITMYIILSICLTVSIILMVTRRLLGEVQAQEEKFAAAFHSSPHGILLTKLYDGAIIEVNDGFVNLLGYKYDEAIGKRIIDLGIWISEEDRQTVIDKLSQGYEVRGAEFQFRKKSGEIMTGLFSASTLTLNNAKCILSNISDITESSQMKQQLQVMATHDYLTGLPNRRLFFDRFEYAMANAQRKKTGLVLMSLDLDNFKTINDELGHDIGDAVLVVAAARLKRVLRKVDTVARFGGDEFILLFGEINSKEEAVGLVQKILQELRQPYIIEEHRLGLTASIGVAMYPENGEEVDDLIKKSDEALYIAKKQGRNNFRFYTGFTNHE